MMSIPSVKRVLVEGIGAEVVERSGK